LLFLNGKKHTKSTPESTSLSLKTINLMSKSNQYKTLTLVNHSSHKLIILGGTFDPFHNGHFSIIKAIKEYFPNSKILLIPTYQSPFKKESMLSARQRLLLLTKLSIIIPNLIIDPYEINKEKVSYSIDTIAYIKNKFPSFDLYFCMGEDAAQSFTKWKNFKSILGLTTLLIVPRTSSQSSRVLEKLTYPPQSVLLPMTKIDISSTEIKSKNRPFTKETFQKWFPETLIKEAKILLNTAPIIGLTGQVGTGKTEATTFLSKTFAIEIIDLDLIGHSILEETPTIKNLVSTFGATILDETNKISRTHLGKIVFSDKHKLVLLNKIVHPLILEKTLILLSKRDKPTIIVGSLLQEIGILDYCSKVVCITGKSDTIIKHIGEKKYNRRQFQQSEKTLLRNSDHTISNDYTKNFYSKLTELFNSLLGL
jgi:nicotinate-nucleotide adenylyltransferase